MNVKDKKQIKAIEMVKENDISIITGFAGTGKSHTALKAIEELKKDGWMVSRVAPTGKAALRIKGTTIHAWLKPVVEEDKFGNPKVIGYGKESFEKDEVLLVDESSMIDEKLWNEIMIRFNKSLGRKKLVFVGDPGQLPPVGDGTPFLDIIKSNNFPMTHLETIHRTKEGNDIIDVAYAIRSGITIPNDSKNVHMMPLQEAIEKMVKEYHTTQIICPMNKGRYGTSVINEVVQKLIGHDKVILKRLSWNNERKLVPDGRVIYKGDKIIVTKNNFPLELTNGTVGIVSHLGMKRIFNQRYRLHEDVPGVFIIRDFDEKELFIPMKFAEKFVDLAYAISVHKAQGNEWEEVIFMATPDQQWMIKKDKRLVYTAITRASENLYIVGGE